MKAKWRESYLAKKAELEAKEEENKQHPQHTGTEANKHFMEEQVGEKDAKKPRRHANDKAMSQLVGSFGPYP